MKRQTPLLLLFLITLVAYGTSCDKLAPKHEETHAAAQEVEALPVRFVTATTRSIVDYDELTGRTAAVEEVDVRAQVSGYLETINFTAGSFVHKGDVLFTLDSRVYKATLEKARADAEAKKADLERLKAELARQQGLIEKNATSQQQLELAVAECAQREAELEAALASAELAQINLDYATIKSPIDGVVSREKITVGNLVDDGVTLLTRVVKIDPLYVYFDVDERTLLEFRRQRQNVGAAENEKLRVKFAVGDGEFKFDAIVDFSEPQINATTGTLEFRSVAKNPLVNASGDQGAASDDAKMQHELIPGLRVRVLFPTSPEYEGVIVPEEAIVTDQDVKRVYVLTEQNGVDFRQVVLGPLQDDNMRVIKQGLEPGERVVVDNLLRLRPDSIVAPEEAAPQSSTRILREDGTVVYEDGSSSSDDIYQWSLTR